MGAYRKTFQRWKMANQHEYSNVDNHDRLRQNARDLIEHGMTPASNGGSLSADVLHFLYERASKPESAADALKLLQELQTYQVELDLLYEQIKVNEHEINEELAHYQSLYEHAPAAYLTVATDGRVIESNGAASLLLGKSQQALVGKTLSEILAPGQEGAVRALLNDVVGNAPNTQIPCNGSLKLPGDRLLVISASRALAGDSILMIMTEAMTHTANLVQK